MARGEALKAIRIVPGEHGGRPVVHQLPDPRPAAGQVLVRVHAAGINRGEIPMARRLREGPPVPSGVEFAGTVIETGADVRIWQPGDRVMGHGPGGHAEQVLADPLALMRVPDALSWVEAAAFPNVFITAHDALVSNGELRPGETVLVNAASSGIGLAAIQIAKGLGAKSVIATSRSQAKLARVAPYGVDVAIDVTHGTQVAEVMAATGERGADIVIDSVGASVFEDNLRSMALKGRLVNIGRLGGSIARLDLDILWLRRLRLIGVTFRTRTEAERLACVQGCARDVLPLLQSGRIQLPVDRTFAFDELGEAHAYMDTDQHVGKLVLLVS
jgi:NADPH2:quinone reductase